LSYLHFIHLKSGNTAHRQTERQTNISCGPNPLSGSRVIEITRFLIAVVLIQFSVSASASWHDCNLLYNQTAANC